MRRKPAYTYWITVLLAVLLVFASCAPPQDPTGVKPTLLPFQSNLNPNKPILLEPQNGQFSIKSTGDLIPTKTIDKLDDSGIIDLFGPEKVSVSKTGSLGGCTFEQNFINYYGSNEPNAGTVAPNRFYFQVKNTTYADGQKGFLVSFLVRGLYYYNLIYLKELPFKGILQENFEYTLDLADLETPNFEGTLKSDVRGTYPSGQAYYQGVEQRGDDWYLLQKGKLKFKPVRTSSSTIEFRVEMTNLESDGRIVVTGGLASIHEPDCSGSPLGFPEQDIGTVNRIFLPSVPFTVKASISDSVTPPGPTPTPTPTPVPTATPTPNPSGTPTPGPTATPKPCKGNKCDGGPSPTPSPSVSSSPTPNPTATPSNGPPFPDTCTPETCPVICLADSDEREILDNLQSTQYELNLLVNQLETSDFSGFRLQALGNEFLCPTSEDNGSGAACYSPQLARAIEDAKTLSEVDYALFRAEIEARKAQMEAYTGLVAEVLPAAVLFATPAGPALGLTLELKLILDGFKMAHPKVQAYFLSNPAARAALINFLKAGAAATAKMVDDFGRAITGDCLEITPNGALIMKDLGKNKNYSQVAFSKGSGGKINGKNTPYFDLAKKYNLNPNSETTKQIIDNIDLTAAEYISKFRNASVAREFPSDYLTKTVAEGLKAEDKSLRSTIRKLLTDKRFAK